MFSLIRVIYSSLWVKGKPAHQLLAGALFIPGGLFLTWVSLFASSTTIYPYFAILGLVLAGFGVALIIKSLIGFSKPNVAPPYPAQAPYGAQPPYPAQAPYGAQPPYPAQAPYGAQPPYPPQVHYGAQPPYPLQVPYGAQPPYPAQE